MRECLVGIAARPRLRCAQVLAHLVTNAATLVCLGNTWGPVYTKSLHFFDVLSHVWVSVLTILPHSFYMCKRIWNGTDLRTIVTKGGHRVFLEGTSTL